MTKRRMVLVAVVLLGSLGPARPADDPTKIPDARQTTEKFLAAALAGKAKEAAALGEPGKAYSREKKIEEFADLNAKKLTLVRVLADDQAALAITENVVSSKRGEEGPLAIRLVKKGNRWLIRDVDFGTRATAKNLQRFLKEHPKAKPVEAKKDK